MLKEDALCRGMVERVERVLAIYDVALAGMEISALLDSAACFDRIAAEGENPSVRAAAAALVKLAREKTVERFRDAPTDGG